jgi:ectoine hydroxylase-related dioxygenase (phytanoyl-CoA dioxygenase family)
MKSFSAKGFTSIPGILAPTDCAATREVVATLGYVDDGVGLSITDTIKVGMTGRIVFHPKLVAAYRDILGAGAYLLPNITWRRNSSSPWHIDEAFRKPHADMEMQGCSFLQCSVYLQDNDRSGGGLDVIPHSHVLEELSSPMTTVALARSLAARAVTVRSSAGDAVLWDGRLLHRSSVCEEPSARQNYAIHWTVARLGADVGRVFRHMLDRAANNGDIANVDRRYDVMKHFRFVVEAPSGFLAAAEAAAVRLFDASSLDGHEQC